MRTLARFHLTLLSSSLSNKTHTLSDGAEAIICFGPVFEFLVAREITNSAAVRCCVILCAGFYTSSRITLEKLNYEWSLKWKKERKAFPQQIETSWAPPALHVE